MSSGCGSMRAAAVGAAEEIDVSIRLAPIDDIGSNPPISIIGTEK